MALVERLAAARSRRGHVTGGKRRRSDLDALLQLRLVTFHHEDIVALGVADMAVNLALDDARIAGDGRPSSGRPLSSVSAAVISLASGSTSRSPIHPTEQTGYAAHHHHGAVCP
jgi:hypothetical protein